MNHRASTLLVLLALGAAGCAAEDPSAHPPVCTGDSGCAAGLVCSFRFCTADEPGSLPLRGRILPPAARDLLQQQVPELAIDPLAGNTITLRRPVVLTGTVRNEGDTFASNLPGELEARTAGEIPGLDYRFTARSLDGLDAQGHGFTLRLLEGRTYKVTFRPDTPGTPPHSFILDAQDVVDGRYDITLPARADYVSFQRFVRLGSADPLPVPGARVVVELPDGRALPEVTTDAEKGSFDVTLPPGTDEVRVRIEAPQAGPLFPDFQSEWLETAPEDGVTAITIPALPPGLEEFEAALRVVAPGADGELAPVSGLSLSMFGNLEGGSLRRSATTDADGVARFTALPGAYEVLVSVPPGLDAGARVARLNLAASSGSGAAPTTVALERRALLGGVVRDASHRPVQAGTVIATLRPDKRPGDTLVVSTAPFQGVIDSQGGFALEVDPGTYDVRVVPDPYTGAPTVRLAGVVVSGPTALPVDLPAPSLAHLQVVGPDGTTIPDAIVELYLGGVEGPDDASGPPPLLVKGTTGPGGTVDLLVPYAP
ncbi:MAG: carboxypeptidase regulatory-like domain-containing protein [Deltaproteobacteria bacterium]|nr:carboxypeptidase regulatory-like domain-containing protein [Deltaproteobacteria bacterium]MCB9786412.1 carboxypeptidase regulatory-like domain-containing protein [Deltaproteobacteria bacterium]